MVHGYLRFLLESLRLQCTLSKKHTFSSYHSLDHIAIPFSIMICSKKTLDIAVWVGSGRSGFRRRNILIFTCKVSHATPSPKVQFPGVILNPNEAVLSCMDSNFALIFWIQCCRRSHRATQNPVLQKIIELHGIQFCFELYIAGNHHFFGLWSIPKVVICYAPSKNMMLWKTEFCHHVHQLLP